MAHLHTPTHTMYRLGKAALGRPVWRPVPKVLIRSFAKPAPLETQATLLPQEALRKYVRFNPSDTSTNANIAQHVELRRSMGKPVDLLVGIAYQNEQVKQSSKVVEALLADPLAAGNETWLAAIKGRDRHHSAVFKFRDSSADSNLPETLLRAASTFAVPSPILSKDHRQVFGDLFPPLPQNDLCLLEFPDFSEAAKHAPACHFLIYVTNQIPTGVESLPLAAQDKVLLTVVDNTEYSPSSVESSSVSFDQKFNILNHTVKINSELAMSGIDQFLKFDTQASSQYFDALQKSNILELSKFLQWFLRSSVLSEWQLRVIRKQIARGDVSQESIQSTREYLRTTAIAECSSKMHADLQQNFIPQTTAFFRHKLSWWKLYLKNDNVEYEIKDFFGSHFMNKSIENYNYVKGQVNAKLDLGNSPDTFTPVNPLQTLKQDVINTRILLEVQLVVYSCILSAFVYYQLPLTVLSLVGYFWFGIHAQTAIAITTLGWVVGFNHVLKTWCAFTKEWLTTLFEEVRVVISKDCIDQGLLPELNTSYETAKDLAGVRAEVLRALDK